MVKVLEIGYDLYMKGVKQGIVKEDKWSELSSELKLVWCETAFEYLNEQ